MPEHRDEAYEDTVAPDDCGNSDHQDEYCAKDKRKTAPDCKTGGDNHNR